MVTEYGGAPVSGAKEGQYYLELDENEERLPRADRQQTAHQSQLRYRVQDLSLIHIFLSDDIFMIKAEESTATSYIIFIRSTLFESSRRG